MKLQSRVLRLVSAIPRGKVTTYKELARAVGRPRTYRAVANAVARNPYPVKIPCHRVVRSNGEVGGYRLGVRRKIKLLLWDGIEVENGRVNLKDMFKFQK
ncbi:MAG: MGMT family protein [Parcubacteria group bacterium]